MAITKKNKTYELKAELIPVLRASGSYDRAESLAKMYEFTQAIQEPLRQGILAGDILGDIFQVVNLSQSTTNEFPLDFLAPGTERNFVAYTIPNHGYIPQRHIEGDYVMMPTYSVGAAIDWLLKYARDARWDIVGRAAEVMRKQFVKKFNDDGYHTLIASAVDRNIIVVDTDAPNGFLSKRLVSLMKVTMRRNGGGNSSSIDRRNLTDLIISPEAQEDMRNWNVDEVDEVTRREIYVAGDGSLNRIFGVNLTALDEFGEGQEYQLYYTNELGGTLPSSKREIVLGLDLSGTGAFIHAVRENVQVFVDENLHREQRAGWYGWAEVGFGVLDNRNVMLGAL